MRFRPLFLMLFFAGAAHAQVTSVSPYSRLGLGEEVTAFSAPYAMQGGVSLAARDPLLVNFRNPASYTALRYTTVEIAFNHRWIKQELQNSSASNSVTQFSYFTLGVPVSEWWGLSAGVLPVTALGYNISTAVSEPSADVVYRFRGTGGLNRAYFGNAFSYKDFSLGFNLNYLFGTLEQTRDVQYTGSGFFNSRNTSEIGVSDFSLDLGAQYSRRSGADHLLTAGLVLGLGGKLGAEYREFDYTYQLTASGFEIPKDTVTDIQGVEGSLTMPLSVGLGVSWGQQGEADAYAAWSLAADVHFTQWSAFRGFNGEQELRDALRIALGGNLVPRLAFGSLERSRNYLYKVQYRAGLHYQQTSWEIGGTGINEVGIGFGIGLPLRARNLGPGEERFNQIQLGILAGRRGNVNDGVIQEKFTTITFGLTLSDKWFIKYKYR